MNNKVIQIHTVTVNVPKPTKSYISQVAVRHPALSSPQLCSRRLSVLQ